jgi:hypothetical protein
MRKILVISGVLTVIFLTLFAFLSQSGAAAIEIQNPLKYNTIEDLIKAVIDFLFTLSLVVAPMVIIIAGFFFIFSQGQPEKVIQARNMVIYALIGLLIMMAAKGIIELIKQVFLTQQNR